MDVRIIIVLYADCMIFQNLLRAIEVASGLSMSSGHDYKKLFSMISKRSNANDSLSSSTIRRYWKKGNTGEHHSQHTKDMYARLVGFPHYKAFCKEHSLTQCRYVPAETLCASSLMVGECLRVRCAINKWCVIEHLGDGVFRVAHVAGMPLYEGDVVCCTCFCKYEPLFLILKSRKQAAEGCYIVGSIVESLGNDFPSELISVERR